ncbi:MAG: hypothetical protein EOP11_24385 [Proteobacteria bacterium]|nr:MAG: hypothetical protein EOP11_24385 [Pseudomonadota bacterium]
MKSLFALALLATAPAFAAPIANDASEPACFEVASHFCGCGLDNNYSGALVRVDISNGQRTFTRIQNFGTEEQCNAAVYSTNTHPACR